MDHAEAIRSKAAEKYLLGEFSAIERDQFEEHFFECRECAEDVRHAAVFVDNARAVMRERPAANVVPMRQRRWQTAGLPIAASVLLACLTSYQNLITIPRLQMAAVDFTSLPASGPSIILDSRAAGEPEVILPAGKPSVLNVDIPTAENAASFRCELRDSAGVARPPAEISAEQARNSVPLLIPGNRMRAGSYTLVVSAVMQDGSSKEIASRNFQLK